jgi:hypothetical protein
MTDKDIEIIIAEKLKTVPKVEDVFTIGGNRYLKIFIIVNNGADNTDIYEKESEILTICENEAILDFHVLYREGRDRSEFISYDLNYYRHIYHRQ